MLAASLMQFVGGSCENATAEECAANDWLLPASVVLVASALGLLLCVALGKFWVGMVALASQTVVTLITLGYALGESTHGDYDLLAFALAVELAAVTALALAGYAPGERHVGERSI